MVGKGDLQVKSFAQTPAQDVSRFKQMQLRVNNEETVRAWL